MKITILKLLITFTFLLLPLHISGCATYKTMESVRDGSPKFFSGTRLTLMRLTKMM